MIMAKHKKGKTETSNKGSRKQTTPQRPKTSGLTGKGYKKY